MYCFTDEALVENVDISDVEHFDDIDESTRNFFMQYI